jgi:hypothetical protein
MCVFSATLRNFTASLVFACQQRAEMFVIRRHILLSCNVQTRNLNICIACKIISRITRIFDDHKPTVANATASSKVDKSTVYCVSTDSRILQQRQWGAVQGHIFDTYFFCKWLEVSIRKVLRPATSTQIFLGFSMSLSEC